MNSTQSLAQSYKTTNISTPIICVDKPRFPSSCDDFIIKELHGAPAIDRRHCMSFHLLRERIDSDKKIPSAIFIQQEGLYGVDTLDCTGNITLVHPVDFLSWWSNRFIFLTYNTMTYTCKHVPSHPRSPKVLLQCIQQFVMTIIS